MPAQLLTPRATPLGRDREVGGRGKKSWFNTVLETKRCAIRLVAVRLAPPTPPSRDPMNGDNTTSITAAPPQRLWPVRHKV